MLVEDPDPTHTRPGTWRKFFERCVFVPHVPRTELAAHASFVPCTKAARKQAVFAFFSRDSKQQHALEHAG